MANSFYDVLETRSTDGREAALLAALPEQIHLAQRRTPAYGRILAGIDPMSITSREALTTLPVTRKSDLTELQTRNRPSAASMPIPPGALARIFASPGPIFDPESRRSRLLALRPRAVRHRPARRQCTAQLLLLSLHPGGFDVRERRPCARLRRFSRRHWQYRVAGAGDRGRAAGRLRRNARLSEDHP